MMTVLLTLAGVAVAGGGLLLGVGLLVDWMSGPPQWTKMSYRPDRERSH